MKTTYAQNNTRSLLLIVGSLGLALVLVAALLGLSEKPDVTIVAMSPASASGNAATAQLGDRQADENTADQTDASAQPGTTSTTTLQAIPADDTAAVAPTTAPQPTSAATGTTAANTTAANTAAAQALIPVPTLAPTTVPTEVPEIAAAVEPLPTSQPSAQASGDVTAVPTDPAAESATTAAAQAVAPTGTLIGNFFTRADEDEGATVTRNEVELTFDQTGGGKFRGVLDITYSDGSQVQIDMNGAFVYAPTPPQVMSTVNGTYRRDAVDDLEDVTTDRGDLSITSFVSGSGALCTPTCFGFTFPPPGSS